GKDTVRRHRWSPIALRGLFAPVQEEIHHRLGDHRRHHFGHRQIQILAFPGAVSVVKRGEQKEDHRGSDGEIRPGTPYSAWKALRVAGHMAQPRECLRGGAKTYRTRERSVLTQGSA